MAPSIIKDIKGILFALIFIIVGYVPVTLLYLLLNIDFGIGFAAILFTIYGLCIAFLSVIVYERISKEPDVPEKSKTDDREFYTKLALNNSGLSNCDKGLFDDAIKDFKQLIELDPDNPTAHNHLGLAFYKKGMLDDAIKHYKEALRLSPDDLEIHHSLGAALSEKGLNEEAKKELDIARYSSNEPKIKT